jgi:hypothetical protein
VHDSLVLLDTWRCFSARRLAIFFWLLAIFAAMKLEMVLPETLARVEYLFTIGTSPGEPLLVEFLLVRFPVRFRLEWLVAEGAGKVFRGRDARRLR